MGFFSSTLRAAKCNFFAGNIERARALWKLIFGGDAPMIIFDVSSYAYIARLA